MLIFISRVLSKTLRKNDQSIFHYYHLFWTFNEFFRILAKNLVRCVETVIKAYICKNVKKNCWTIGFSSFWDFDKRNLCFCRKMFWQGCQKNFRRVQWNTYRAIFPNGSLENWRIFEKIFEVFGTMMEKLFQGWQNSNRCPREQFMKTFFHKRKIRSFFPILSQCLLPAKFFARVAKPAIYVSVEVFGGKTIFEIYIIFHIFFGLWSKKRLVGKKTFSRVVTTAIRASRDIFWEKVLFSKKKFVCSSALEFEQFFLYTDKKQSGCQRNNLLIQKKVGGKNLWKICFFKSFSDFQEKSLNNYTKKLARLSKFHSKIFRGLFLGHFFGMKKLCSTFLVFERNFWTFS